MAETFIDGVEVWSDDGWTRIKHVHRHKVQKGGYRIMARTGFVDCTEDHSLVIDGKEVSPKSLSVGDVVELHPLAVLPDHYTSISVDMAWLYGFYMAEGTTGKYDTKWGVKYAWHIDQDDMKPLERCQRILKAEIGMDTKIITTKNGDGVMYRLVPHGGQVKHPIKAAHMRFSRLYRKEKTIPYQVLNGSQDVKQAFLEGMLDGDGHKDRYMIEIGQKHHCLIQGLCMILDYTGQRYSLDRDKRRWDYLRIRWFPMQAHTKNLPKSEILEIERYDIDEYVYDLETENHHFCGGVGNVLLHNTDSCYVQIHRKEVAEPLLEKLNEVIAPYVLEAGEYYDAMIFTATSGGKALKKRYAGISNGHVTIVGMQALSNSVCQMSRDLQRNILRLVLEGKSEYEIRQHMEKVKVAVLDGTLDKQLVISKKVKPIADYKLGEKSTGQPYMRALQKYVAQTGREVPYIEYVYTTDDCAPIIEGQPFPDNIDRELYWKRYGHKIIEPILKSAGIDIGEFNVSQSLDAFLSS